MAQITLHTSSLFDPKVKNFRQNVSVTVDSATGLIVRVFERESDELPNPTSPANIDLRGKYVLPGLVDAHTHVFLHSYEYVAFRTITPPVK